MRIDRIQLSTTIAYTSDGRYVTMPNHMLYNSTIINLGRSSNYWIIIDDLVLDSTTPKEIIIKIKDEINNFLKENKKFYGEKSLYFSIAKLDMTTNSLHLVIWVEVLGITWQFSGKYVLLSNKFTYFLRNLFKELNLSYTFPIQPVTILDNANK